MEKVLIQISVPKNIKERLKNNTKKNGLTINALLVMLIKKYLESEEN